MRHERYSDLHQTDHLAKPDQQEVDWENYPAYKWFMKQVGGADRMIPKADGLSWMLRIHHHEIATALGVSTKMKGRTKSLVGDIDKFYGFKRSRVRRYGCDSELNHEATPAHLFFTTTAFGPESSGELKDMFSAVMDPWQEQAQKVTGVRGKALNLLGNVVRDRSARQWIDVAIAEEVKIKFLQQSTFK